MSSEKHWLSTYLTYKAHDTGIAREDIFSDEGPERALYYLIQPTGYMYGMPSENSELLSNVEADENIHAQLVLLDTLINVAFLYKKEQVATPGLLLKIITDVVDYYTEVYDEINVGKTNWFGKAKDIKEVVIKVLNKRIAISGKGSANVWKASFNQAQFFIDAYIFAQWQHTSPDDVLKDYFRQEKVEISYNTLKVMSAAAHANKSVEKEEEYLFMSFIENSGLPAEKKRIAQEYFEHGLAIQDIPVERTEPWALRKFYFELATLTIWSDRKLDSEEFNFLKALNESLGFEAHDLNKSLIAVEGFLLQHWNNARGPGQGFLNLAEDYITRVSRLTTEYKTHFITALKNNNHIIDLIVKGSSKELTQLERDEIRQHILKILHGLPPLKIIFLPHQFFTYQNLLRVIPKEVIDSLQA